LVRPTISPADSQRRTKSLGLSHGNGRLPTFRSHNRALGIPLAIPLALALVVRLVNNSTASIYYWGALGVVVAMRRLEQTARAQARTMADVNRNELRRSIAGIK